VPFPRRIEELQTPALIIDSGMLDGNLRTMSARLPRARTPPVRDRAPRIHLRHHP